MRQQSLADGRFEKYRKKTRKELFLEEMDQIIPWQELAAAIEPFYPKPEGAGRRPKGAERMLRIHFLQHWFELSDPGAEEALYDSRAMRELEWDLDKPNRILSEFLTDNQIPFVDLLREFREHAGVSGQEYYLTLDKHWNKAGHALAADIVADALTARVISK